MNHATTPAPSQVALAMAIVKHKPADQDIKEYILRIRQHIKSSRENTHFYPQVKFFDSVSFWQKAYEKSEAEQSKLLDRVFELERRNEALVAKLQVQENDAGKDEAALKRKTPAGKNAAGARKRTRTQINTGNSRTLEYSYDSADSFGGRFEYIEEVTGPFMRQFYALQKTLQKRPSNGELARSAVILCQTISTEMSNLSSYERVASGRAKKVPLESKDPDILAVLHSVDCAFQLLCQALKRLSGSLNEAGILVYHIVELYESTMNALQQECKSTTDQLSCDAKTKTKISKPKKSTKSKRLVPSQSTGAQLGPHSELAAQITRLLNSMAISLDVASAGHQSLLEGFLFVLLGRVGKLLSLFVFQDLQSRPDLHADTEKLPTPAGLNEVDMNDQSQSAAKMEAKHVIWLLERALAVMDNFQTSAPTPPSQNIGVNSIFTSKIKERLQSTLLQAVFGGSSEWRHALQPTNKPDQRDLDRLLNHSQTSEQTTPDWFIQEVWRLLGWEMLERKSV
ncbi:uncharacterized protein KD926_003649 [Aspergillus affinis]|uniref:uncharacterized protein n=1 Tax=Aspergillus affinis TaxID=1070780 RepID=UPI0022FF134F|nr:uncharacterized protein KD926_003649 [Aspergillus affinis]KAI9043498.1 hypothetical protein KD926_003649 [Aspergillus affinis]